jgi:Mrp family chromosome partitioning ATPase
MIAKLKAAIEARMVGQGSAADTKRSFTGESSEPRFLTLAAKVFWGAMPARTVAIVSCYPGEGATTVTASLLSFLAENGKGPVSSISAAEFLESRSQQHTSDSNPAAGTRNGADDEIVLVDCPALFFAPSAIRVSPYVDGFFLIVEDGARSKTEIQRAVSTIEAGEGRILGIILNKRRYPLPEWLYSLLR